MNKNTKGAFVANAASLGLNWIYNIPYLDRLAKQGEIVFLEIDPAKYKRARKAWNAYPNAEVGDLSFQGNILKWLLEAWKDTPDFNQTDYLELIHEKIKPGGTYEGWVESFGQKLIFNRLIDRYELSQEKLVMDDDQLVGFVPYIAAKELGYDNDRAWDLAQGFTSNEEYRQFYDVFDALLTDIKTMSMKDALKKSLKNVPMQFGFKLTMALNTKEPKEILNIVNTGSPIGYSLPILYTILAHSASFEEAIRLNTKFGGASSDRGLLLGLIFAQISEIPENWLEKTHF